MGSRPIRRPRRRPVAGRRAILKTGGGGAPSIADWALNGSSLDFDFQNNLTAINRYPAGLGTVFLSVSNNGGYVQNLAGLWIAVGSNTARRSDKGLLSEAARTNNLLWCRDMTNAAWVKGATATVAQTQTGIDGTGNSATLITGGAVQATNTVLQTIVLGLASDSYSVWLKRVTGSGTVEITADNGSTWTSVALTTAYQQFQVPQVLTNPVCGIRIQTNGDQVAADFNQLETNPAATSPILTTTATATRNTDIVQIIGAGATIILASASAFYQTAGVSGVGATQMLLSAGNDFIGIGNFSATSLVISDGTTSAQPTIGGGGTVTANTVKSAYGMDNSSMTAVANGGTQAVQSTSTWATQIVGQTVYIGNRAAGDRAMNGYIQRASFALGKGVFDGLTA